MKTPVAIARTLPLLAGIALSAVAALAPAGAPAFAADVYALTPAEKAAALQSGAAARGEGATSANDAALPIHGEFGALVGTGGTRSVYGTAAIPIGDRGGAIVSFENSRVGGYRRR